MELVKLQNSTWPRPWWDNYPLVCSNWATFKELHLNGNWVVGIDININNKRIVILNVYMPYECHDNEPKYINCLAHISAIIVEYNTTCVYVVGDYNAHITDDWSLFAKHLLNLCRDTGMIFSSKLLLPHDSFIFVSNWETTSWLDHYVCSSDAHDAIHSMEIYHIAMLPWAIYL